MQKDVTINAERRLYVIPCGDDGFTCWGFDNAYREACQLAEALNRPVPAESEIGTMSVFNYHRELLKFARENKVDFGTWFDYGTDPMVKAVLEAARLNDMRVRIFYGETDPEKENCGLSWMNEHDMYGSIGRSTGILKFPLLVPPGDDGGCAILTSRIVKIIGTSMCVSLYEHPAFRLPEMVLVDETREDVLEKGYVVGVDVAGERQANFKTRKKANDWIDFMSGRRIKP